ncbi:OPT/YSL family transporter [Paenibacillus sp. MSJ-34]|uniref:OPT/YSL family transporter n=1 Tax=Paenibacillus sp. MSJ-34 TaxID=2841529 RepID=UPI001C10B7D9|nr:OPT/YSL family transporter [Paenibacillus sp. MSJ-34]MBU5441190.1 OPT/YSL family transporter [Paenibacillus sp. MSJ-34]
MEKQTKHGKHPKAIEPFTLLLTVATAVLGALIGMQLIVTLGITASTSIIGALLAMLIARIPVAIFRKYRSIHRQNLIQTAISSATYGAANSLLIPIGIPFILGKTELIMPMLIGAALAMFVDSFMLYRLFNTDIFPASGTWPDGRATAESIFAGDKGGKRAGLLGLGIAGGVAGSIFGIPMSAFGVAFIGNVWALAMFGIGLLIKGYSMPVLGVDLTDSYIPHGFMIGAGLVALIQVTMIIMKKKKKDDGDASATAEGSAQEHSMERKSKTETSRSLIVGFVLYLIVSLIVAVIGGLITEMSVGMFIGFIIFAAFMAYVHELIVGISAMHSGWFPAFAVALITLIIGLLIGFPPTALALLVGFSAATGPAFADMGFDLKAGYILRGNGSDPEFEKDGRRQQFTSAMIAFGIALIVVLFTYNHYFAQDLVPPVDKVYAATIEAGVSGDIAKELLIWAIPGALLQWLGGQRRQLGILFSTGLLLTYPEAGWAVLAGLLIRTIITKWKGEAAEAPISILAAGFIAGDALYNFFSSVFSMKKG